MQRIRRALSQLAQPDGASADPIRNELTPHLAEVMRAYLETAFTTAAATADVDPPDLAFRLNPPPIAGRYRLLDEIGRGGMGSVYRARDEALGRELAVKMIRGRSAGEDRRVRRFLEEAQIGGQLQHPGVVPVYDLGRLDDQRPFFAMKLVAGRTLAELLRERGRPDEDLPRYVTIFLQVCQTIAYAHARGVIHRDLKPSNVMVGAFGEVLVMDWGLARLLAPGADGPQASGSDVVHLAEPDGGDGPPVSTAGSVIGTPSYMAPEQARGEASRVDERADVFGLGAILCEILTSRPPFEGASTPEIREKAAHGELSDAFTRLDGCGADAELISLARSCLAVERDERPRDAGAVARRVEAYQAGVQQRLHAAELARVEAETRAAEERKRRRVQLGLAASIVGLVVLGGGGWAWIGKQRADRRAATALRVNDALAEARVRQGQARAAAADDLTKWTEALAAIKQAEGILANGEPTAALRSRVEQLKAALMQEQAAARAEAAQLEKDRKLVAQLETIRGHLAEHFSGVESDAAYARAFREYGLDLDQMGPREAGARIAPRPAAVEIAAALDAWANVRRTLLKQSNEDGWRRLLAVASDADPDPWRRTLREQIGRRDLAALQKLAQGPNLDAQPAVSLTLLGMALADLKDFTTAATVLDAAWRAHPDDFWINFHLAAVMGCEGTHQYQEATRFLTTAAALRPRSAMAQHRLIDSLTHQGRLTEALTLARIAVRRWPDATAHNGLGIVLAERGSLDEAIVAYRAAIRMEPNYLNPHANLGAALLRQGKLDEAIAEFRIVLQLDPMQDKAHSAMGEALRLLKRLDEAVAAHREAVRLNPDEVQGHNNLGLALADQGKLDEAIAAYQIALRLAPNQAETHSNLGGALRLQGKLDEALAEQRTAVRLKPDYAPARYNLGMVHFDRMEWNDAVAALRAARDLAKARPELAQDGGGLLKDIEPMLGHAIHLADMEQRLPEFLSGKAQPAQPTDAFFLATMCQSRKLYGAAARFWRRAFLANPAMAEDLDRPNRYKAACAAALAGCGQSEDDPPLDDAARSSWREQALKWLQADLRTGAKLVVDSPQYRTQAAGFLLKWKANPDLSGVRDPDALSKLPEEERAAWQSFWDDLDALFRQIQQPGPADISVLRDILRSRPDYAEAHVNLGVALLGQGKIDEAHDELRTAVRLNPDLPQAHFNLGQALTVRGELDAAVNAFRTALRLRPDHALSQIGLGNALADGGQVDEAIAAYRTAIQLDPRAANAHFGLAHELDRQGDLDGAIAAYREVVRLKPDHPQALCNLGLKLRKKGQYAEALAMLRRGHEVGSKGSNWRYPSAAWANETERMIALAKILPSILSGQAEPGDAAEAATLAQMCYYQGLHGASTLLWGQAFQMQPALARDMNVQNRYCAACAAALAGFHSGKDNPPLDEAARSRCRRQALDWLRADLSVWAGLLTNGPPQDRLAVIQTLQHWKTDPDLAGSRDPTALVKLAEDERAAWQGLWDEFEATLHRAQELAPPASELPANVFAR